MELRKRGRRRCGVVDAECIWGSGRTMTPRKNPWCARLLGIDERWGFRREFINGVFDWTHANGKRGGRGVRLYFVLRPGIYEFWYPVSWKHDSRDYLSVDIDGSVTKITKEEVIICLESEC